MVYLDVVQYSIAPAEYFRVFTDLPDYLAHSFFLPYLNNEQPTKNQDFKKAMMSLEELVLFMWDADRIVHPKHSAWFG